MFPYINIQYTKIMDISVSKKRSHDIGNITDLVIQTNPYEHPFLHYFPELLKKTELAHLNTEQAYAFTKIALQYEKPEIVSDALHILDKLIRPDDGSLKVASRDMFFDNRSFFWSNLGGRTESVDVITHIFNKVSFILQLG